MVLGKVFERFAEYSPVTVMMRGIMEYVVPPERLDEIFREQAQEQYEDELRQNECTNAAFFTGNKTGRQPGATNAHQHPDRLRPQLPEVTPLTRN